MIDRKQLYDVCPLDGRRYHLSTAVLMHLNLKFFAGPVKVPARGKCVQWWGSTTQKHFKLNTSVDLYSGFRSRWVHCD